MCWSKNVSLSMTLIGLFFTYYSYYFIDKVWALNVFYFTIMQLIQYIGYLYIDQCNHPINRLMSYLNYIHLAFQPIIFIIGFNSLFKKIKVTTKTEYSTVNNFVGFAFIIGMLLILRLIPINISNNHNYKLERENCVWCGNTCSYSGIKHISFKLPLRNNPQYLTPTMFTHFALFYLPFILLFNKKVSLIMLLIFISSLIPSIIFKITPAETGTIWCSISIIQWIISYLILNLKF